MMNRISAVELTLPNQHAIPVKVFANADVAANLKPNDASATDVADANNDNGRQLQSYDDLPVLQVSTL